MGVLFRCARPGGVSSARPQSLGRAYHRERPDHRNSNLYCTYEPLLGPRRGRDPMPSLNPSGKGKSRLKRPLRNNGPPRQNQADCSNCSKTDSVGLVPRLMGQVSYLEVRVVRKLCDNHAIYFGSCGVLPCKPVPLVFVHCGSCRERTMFRRFSICAKSSLILDMISFGSMGCQ